MRLPEHGWLRWVDAASPHNTNKRDLSEDPACPLPYLVAARVRAPLWSFFAASCSVLSSRVVPPRTKRLWFAVFGLPTLFPTCCRCAAVVLPLCCRLLVLRVFMNGG